MDDNAQGQGNSRKRRKPRVDLPMKKGRRRFQNKGRFNKPRRDNRKSRYDADYIEEDEKHNANLELYYREQRVVPDDEMDQLFATLAVPLPSSFRISRHGAFRDEVRDKMHGEMKELFEEVVRSGKAKGASQEATGASQPQRRDQEISHAKAPAEAVIKSDSAPGKEGKVEPVVDSTDTKHEPTTEHKASSVPANPSKPSRAPNAPVLSAPRPLPWYPDELAWTVTAPRQMLRRDNVLSTFHRFLVRMNDLGAINRQEAVSMIPPLLLDVQQGQSVIDMCAAPGSKTAQIVERVMESRTSVRAPGVVVANDADISRCWMLAHQLRRFCCPQLIVTNHEAQRFPKIMQFDRVLCDVPCSGDGTLRKAPDIWRRWHPDMGVALHRLQKQIVERGVELLKPGGTLVYSTCSMNPIENEAVVAHVLRTFGKDVELVDCSEKLPELKRRPGLTHWFVKDSSSWWNEVDRDSTGGNTVDKDDEVIKAEGEMQKNEDDGAPDSAKDSNVTKTPDEEKIAKVEDAHMEAAAADIGEFADEARPGLSAKTVAEKAAAKTKGRQKPGWFVSFGEVPIKRRRRIVESLFPPTSWELGTGKYPLERCLRLVPQDQDTGAFFVAVFQKKQNATCSGSGKNDHVGEINEEARGIDGEDRVGGGGAANGAGGDGERGEEGEGLDDEDRTSDSGDVNIGNGGIAEGGGDGHVDEKEEGEGLAGARAGDAGPVVREEQQSKREIRTTRLIADDALVSVRKVSGDVFDSIVEFYQMDRSIAEMFLMTRGSDASTFKKIVGVSQTVRGILECAVGSRDETVGEDKKVVRVVNAGVRVLERTDQRNCECWFRLVHDGAQLMRGEVAERVMESGVVRAEVGRLLREQSIDVENIAEGEAERLEFWKRVLAMGSGSAMIVCDGEEVVVWVGLYKVATVMPTEVVAALRERFGGEVS